ncbi:uncharacterized protein PAC_14626 [Phialocephala subalpina]|uniref:AB hydrolase-1 domain-containing protein n=1 Tax=Phialocephala subalpina TaxID=576137 RepID=A0A1L7XIE5_9HELO|nr:uncharacterized protein PAC_14626 [Phialocephala subalpina]
MTNLTMLNSKQLYYRRLGTPTGPHMLFLHGLGSSSEYFSSLITHLGLEKTYSIHLLDLEGQGHSPTSAESTVSISSYTADVLALAEHSHFTETTIIAHSLGCLIALKLAIEHPEIVSKLILLGPPPSPFPEIVRNECIERARTVRRSGMSPVAELFSIVGTSSKSKTGNALAVTAVRTSLLAQEVEGYAKGCIALGEAAEALPVQDAMAETLIITGDEDKFCPPVVLEGYAGKISGLKVVVLPQVGHYHIWEDLSAVAEAVDGFL